MRKDCRCYALLKASELDTPAAVCGERSLKSIISDSPVTREEWQRVRQCYRVM
jgi:hypothetical protein